MILVLPLKPACSVVFLGFQSVLDSILRILSSYLSTHLRFLMGSEWFVCVCIKQKRSNTVQCIELGIAQWSAQSILWNCSCFCYHSGPRCWVLPLQLHCGLSNNATCCEKDKDTQTGCKIIVNSRGIAELRGSNKAPKLFSGHDWQDS